eukprot:m.279405 g.279405  ORF g.279405 m.279405 type:complete len:140 (+) comp15743_c0_seq1:3774-4193(+)
MRVINSCCLSCACALLLSFLLSSVLEFCCDPSFVFCDCVSTCRCPSSTPMLINFQSVYQHCAEVVGDVLVILDIHAAPMTTPVELPIFHEQPQEGAHQVKHYNPTTQSSQYVLLRCFFIRLQEFNFTTTCTSLRTMYVH